MPATWYRVVAKVRGRLGGVPGFRGFYRIFPTSDRCKHCYAPFGGPFAIPFRLYHIRPSRKNPRLCTT